MAKFMHGRFAEKMKEFKHNRFMENLETVIFPGVGSFEIPEIDPEQWIPCEFIGFNYATGCKSRTGKGVHFFIDDYQFERVWRQLPKYAGILAQYEAVMTPDFSTFRDWPHAMQIYNHYRKHYIGAYLQSLGVRVYPTISWSDEASYSWCFDGEPVGGCVCVSSVGTQRDAESKRLFAAGYAEMCDRLEPETIIFYGKVPDDCKGNIIRIKSFQEKFDEVKIDGR